MSAERAAEATQLTLLRHEVARLISRTLELERQVEDLRRAHAEVAIESVVASLLQALRSAERALADEAGADAGRRYSVAALEATIRASLTRQHDRLVMSLPRPELALAPEALSSLRLTLAHVPTLPEPREIVALGGALERAQAAFVVWPSETAGARAAGELTTQATWLLAEHERWTAPAFLEHLLALAQAAVRLANTVDQAVPTEVRATFRLAVSDLLERLRPPLTAGQAVAADLLNLAAAIERLTQAYWALVAATSA